MTPRPGDEDEDWEDDFVGFKAPPPGAVASAAPASNEDDFGSFTQISMPANGDTIENDDAAVAPSAEEALQLKKDSPLFNDPPAVETVGESSEFSQSETTEDVSAGAAGSTTMLASRTESVVSDNTDDAMAPTLLEPHGEDAVVDKDTSERSEGEEKKNIPEAGNDDSFGDFGGFSQPPSPAEDKVSAEVDILASPAAGSLEEENESKNIAPDAEMIEFGDSEEPETTVNQSAPIAVESVEKNVDFGDFGAVDDKKSDAPLSVDTVDNSDSFGDFGTAQVESPVDPIATHSTAGNETNGDFGTTEASKPNTEDSEPAVETADNSDSFGDFGAAEIVTPSGTDEPRSTTEGSSDDVVKGKPDLLDATVDDLGTSQPSGASNDDFGDFGAAASPPATEQDDDDFGDFGEAKSAPVSNDDKDDFGDVTSAKPEPATNDDFGDFGSAELSTEADGKDDGGEPGFAKPTEATKEDDDFGDFDAAQPADATNDDDDFGDFDDFDAAEPPEATNDDDDFGDFDVAKPTDTTSQDDGDDFGDFDAADPAPAANNDDEFGDFDAAGPAPAEKGNDDDFGDFNDVDDAPVGPPPSPAPQRSSSSLSASDPVLQNVTAAMHRMFQKPECQVEADSRESSDTASIEKSSIDELVKSLQAEDSPSGESDELPSFWDMLKQSELLRKGDPQTIVTGKPPYRLHYPLHGFTSIHETKRPPEVRRASVPAVLNVKLRGVRTESANASATPSESKQKSPPPVSAPVPAPGPAPVPVPPTSNRGTVVQLPPKKAAEDPARVDNFLKKIPNLSFMLSPTLSLPAQS